MTEKPDSLTTPADSHLHEVLNLAGRGELKECHDSKAVPYVEAPAPIFVRSRKQEFKLYPQALREKTETSAEVKGLSIRARPSLTTPLTLCMKIITGYAKENRRHLTLAERRLKVMLQRWKIMFRSQRPIDNYIADFILPNRRLVLEVDGSFHNNRKWYDDKRTAYIEAKGFKVLRFTNEEVLGTDCKHIKRLIESYRCHHVQGKDALRWYGSAAY